MTAPSYHKPYSKEDNRFSSSYAALDGLYAVHDELGCGGFGKVRLATHLLTSQKVAIKIIDKLKIKKDDLPRVKTELDALMSLSHQNICRLYHCIDTPSKFFIVMEYCSGGEMFDYIVKKERLEESEARYFFRQLVQAIAYVHSLGFAHRDLKPENLLLTEDLQLKLIDFGLCARSSFGLDDFLHTCCGSPAYAAPELIQTGRYHEPDYLSPLSKDLLRLLMQVDPEKRITISELIAHPWINKKYTQALKWSSIYNKNIVDEDIIHELACHFGLSFDEMEALWKFDYLTATYYLLLQQKRRGMNYILPLLKQKNKLTDWKQVLLTSQTIHASLDNDLNNSGLNESEVKSESDEMGMKLDIYNKSFKENVAATPPAVCEQDKNLSYAYAMLSMPSTHSGISPKQRVACGIRRGVEPFVTPTRLKTKPQPQCGTVFDTCSYRRPRNKENWPPTAMRVRGQIKIINDTRPKSNVYGSPSQVISSPSSANTRSQSVERPNAFPLTPVQVPRHDRTPRSSSKTPRFRQRVFASLERQADKMINLLTPRKVKSCGPEILKQAKTMVNISITSSKDPKLVRDELLRVFAEQDICTEHHGWKISGWKKDEFNRVMTVELEVVLIEMGNKEELVGVKRKRLNGDAFLYKKVCEQVLRLAGL
ncbi:unnamed protein product [Thelazia callipaeda]|uniref:non-specific serine/threonine protein kinase n=1 Tax=Thelazia callipaeda TaxID=103827 RepID=A0A0N5CZ31_THECL|nr:unnamed protein product [Thelazia callipaeda]